MAEILVADLQVIIIVAALMAGALRGFIGYWLTAPDTEPFQPQKIGKTITRYALFNLVTVNVLALSGVTWTVVGVIIYALAQLAAELGFDLKKT